MSNITPQLVKDLRDITGVGMAKCKQALEEAKGDLERAVSILRATGIASAVKKENRETKEGIIAIEENQEGIALVEVNTETDFVVSNQKFRDFAQMLAQEIAKTKPKDLETFIHQTSHKDPSSTIDEMRAILIQSLGENIQIKRLIWLPKNPNRSFGIYSHMDGKIVAIVELEGGGDQYTSLARDIAMHVASEAPEFLDARQVPLEIKQNEEAIAREQAKGKPSQMMDKIVEGKMQAFYDKACLVSQKFIKDPTLSIDKLLALESKKSGKTLTITQFLRWKIGS